jgi:hypothetical protein
VTGLLYTEDGGIMVLLKVGNCLSVDPCNIVDGFDFLLIGCLFLFPSSSHPKLMTEGVKVHISYELCYKVSGNSEIKK